MLESQYSVRKTSYAIKYDGVLDSIVYGIQLVNRTNNASWQGKAYWQDTGKDRYLQDSIELRIRRIVEYPVIWNDWK